MKLNDLDDNASGPDISTFQKIVFEYRRFAGTKAAFHVEYPWLPGQFETKDEEMDFNLLEYARPDDYEVVEQWHDDAVAKLSAAEVELMDTRTSRNIWRVAAILLLVPYIFLWYMWKASN